MVPVALAARDQPRHEQHQEQQREDEKEHTRDAGRSDGNTTKAEPAREKCDRKKDERPVQHGGFCFLLLVQHGLHLHEIGWINSIGQRREGISGIHLGRRCGGIVLVRPHGIDPIGR